MSARYRLGVAEGNVGPWTSWQCEGFDRRVGVVEFERFEASLRADPRVHVDYWAVDGSVVYKNGEVLADLAHVDRVALGYFHYWGVTTRRIVFDGPSGLETVSFTLRLHNDGQETWDEFQHTILRRFGHYRPNGKVDLRGDAYSRRVNLALSLFAMAVGLFFAYITIYPLTNGSELARTSLFTGVFGTVAFATGVAGLIPLCRRPHLARNYAASLPAVVKRSRFPPGAVDKAVAGIVAVVGVLLLIARFSRAFG